MKTKILFTIAFLLIIQNLNANLFTIFFNLLPNPMAYTANAKTITATEDTDFAFVLTDFPYTCSNPGGTCPLGVKRVRIETLPASGTLFMDNNSDGIIDPGENVTVAQVILSTDITKLKYKPALNAAGLNAASFTFNIYTDERATFTTNNATLTINITAVNDAPTSNSNTVTTNEDVVYTFAVIDFPYTDPEATAIAKVKINTLPANGILYLDLITAPITVGQEITTANITKIRFKPDNNASGSPCYFSIYGQRWYTL